MLKEKIHRFGRTGLTERKKKHLLITMVSFIAFMLAGCGDSSSKASKIEITLENQEIASLDDSNCADAENIAMVYRDIYDEAVRKNTVGSLETIQCMVARLGEHGYVAVDSANQVDMAGAERAVEFCKAVEEKEDDRLTIIVIMERGFRKFDLETEGGKVNVVRSYYQYDQNGQLQNRSTVSYPADFWEYTKEGYLIFEGSYFSKEDFVLTSSDTSEHTALRVLPLPEKCREWGRKYILPVGYGQNNIFLTDWCESEVGELDFYDIFDHFYPILYKRPIPYTANENLEVDSVYQIPEDVFENVIMTYFDIDREVLRSAATYSKEDAAYEYRPRGFYEAEYPDIPYPEVVNYTENKDGTITLMINAVYPNENTSKAYSHETVIRLLHEDGFQYVSNRMVWPEEGYDAWWHSDRLQKRESSSQERENNLQEEGNCLLSEAEKDDLKDAALAGAEQAAEAYKEIELTGESSFGSNIKEFTEQQRKKAVTLLGKAGYVSVSEDTNMENYEKVEAFYAAYRKKADAMVTIYDINPDGLIRVITFIHRNGKLQTYYIGIGWQEGGIPEIRSTLVSDIAEIKLTEKGYFIYAYKDLIVYSSLRQYWRIKPLSDKCRELTRKYVYGLSYVNYNVLITNWDSSNVEEILMPCMFEDIYRIDTGENLRPEKGKIPAETYEKIMTTYFPVSVTQLREKCGYDEKSDSYAYEMIFARQYPPFGEVVDYTENPDGTITLYVDGVWADYNSDCAFTNEIMIQPFDDGTFRYLSNSIEQKELEVPKIVD